MQWACYKKASAYGSRVGWTLARRIHTELFFANYWRHFVRPVKLMKVDVMDIFRTKQRLSLSKMCKMLLQELDALIGMRRVWRCHFNCRSAIVQILSDTISLFDIICKRAVMFIRNCLGSQPDVVRYTANHGVYFSRMSSVLGRMCSLVANISLCLLMT